MPRLARLSCRPVACIVIGLSAILAVDDGSRSGMASVRLRSIDHVVPVGNGHLQDWHGAWHGQVLQDCIVHALLDEKRGGYFIDLAANDPVVLSNTRALERDHDWRGLCIEPNPVYHADLLEYRNCTVVAAAVSDSVKSAWFEFTDDAALNVGHTREKSAYRHSVFGHVSTSKELKGNTSRTAHPTWLMPIGPILERHAVPSTVDFMSLDVEGSEMAVLSAFPFDRHNITLVLIEISHGQAPKLLEQHGYRVLCRTSLDTLFVHEPSMHKLVSWATEARISNRTMMCDNLVLPHSPPCQQAHQLHAKSNYGRSGFLRSQNSGRV